MGHNPNKILGSDPESGKMPGHVDTLKMHIIVLIYPPVGSSLFFCLRTL